jgi:TfoX/Sxy family transcriptional regulator of competence genes
MASDPDFVEYVCNQAGFGNQLVSRKMFGEYALYLDTKIVALVCDNQLYLKPTPEGRAMLGKVFEQAPFPGAKAWFCLDDELDDRARLNSVLRATANALPMPKPKVPKAKPKAAKKTKPR